MAIKQFPGHKLIHHIYSSTIFTHPPYPLIHHMTTPKAKAVINPSTTHFIHPTFSLSCKVFIRIPLPPLHPMIPHHPCHPKTSSKALIHFPHPHPPPPLHGYSSSHGCTSRCSIRSNSPTSTMLPHSGSRFNLLGEGVRISSFLQSKDILTASFPIASQNYWRLRYIGSGFSMKRLL